MKKKILSLVLICFTIIGNAQVKLNQNAANSSINTSSAFMDASSSSIWNASANQGKGLLFPRVNLVTYTAMSHAGPYNASNNPNYFDGLLVFNTATGIAPIGGDSVYPGYYYYRNTTTSSNGGHWISFKGLQGIAGELSAAFDDTQVLNYKTWTSLKINTELGNKVNTSSLSTVAISGNYNDLINTPSIPTQTSQLTNNSGYISNEVQVLSISNDTIYLSGGSFVKLPINFSGNYNDLTNKPNLDGSETKVTAGTNVTLTGIGTTANPYVVSSSSLLPSHGMQIITSVGTTNFIVPAGVSSVKVNMVGAGGGSGYTNQSYNRFGGGGGSFFSGYIYVTANELITVTIGAGGTAGSFSTPGVSGAYGELSSIKDGNNIILITLNGGSPGQLSGGNGGSGVINNTLKVVGYINNGESGLSVNTPNGLGGGVISPFSGMIQSQNGSVFYVRNCFMINNTMYGKGGNGNYENGLSGCCIIEW